MKKGLFFGFIKRKNDNQDLSRWKSVNLFKHKYAYLKVYEADTFLYISVLEVHPKKRNKGIGSTIMRRIVWYARRFQKDVVLEATDALGSSLEDVFRFYKKFNFQKGCIERIPYRHNMYLKTRSKY